MDGVSARAAVLEQTLAQSQGTTDQLCSLLDDFVERTAALQAVMLPIHARIQSLTRVQDNAKLASSLCESMLLHFDVSRDVERQVMEGPRGDLEAYIRTLDKLDAAVELLDGAWESKSVGAALRHTRDTRELALGQCEAHVGELLAEHAATPAALLPALRRLAEELPRQAEAAARLHRKAEATSDIGADTAAASTLHPPPLELLPALAVPHLQVLCSRLLAAKQPGCLRVYCERRREVVDACMQAVGLDARWSAEQLPWADIQRDSKQWIQSVYVFVHLAVAEHRLAAAVLPPAAAEEAFAAAAAPLEALVGSMGSVLRCRQKDTERLFVLLDVACHLAWALPRLLPLLQQNKRCARLAANASQLQREVAEAAARTVAEFEDAVRQDSQRHAGMDGTVHPLTSYVVYYIKRLFELHERAPLDTLLGGGGAASGAEWASGAALMRIMLVLQTNLEDKASKYKSQPLAHCFMMNNTHYLVQAVRQCKEMLAGLGDAWLKRQERVVEQCARDLLVTSWGAAIDALRPMPPPLPGAEAAVAALRDSERAEVKQAFASFNATLQQLAGEQACWAIPDTTLRDRLKGTIRAQVVPRYRAFVEHHMGSQFSKYPQRHIKFSADQVDRMLCGIFENRAKS